MIDIFKGEDNDFSKAVCLNAAAGLIVSEKIQYLLMLMMKQENIYYQEKLYKSLKEIQNA